MGKPAHGAPAGAAGGNARSAAACKTVMAICPDASQEEVEQALKSAVGDVDQAVIALTENSDWMDVKAKKKKRDGGRTGDRTFDRNDRGDRGSRDFPYRENDRRGGGERSGRGPRGRGFDRGGDQDGNAGRGRGGRGGRGRGRGESAPGRGRHSESYSQGPAAGITYSVVPDENQVDNAIMPERSPARPVTSAVISDPSVSWASKVKASQATAPVTPEPEASPNQDESGGHMAQSGQDDWGQGPPVDQPTQDEEFVPHQQFAPQGDSSWGHRQPDWSTAAGAAGDPGASETFTAPPGMAPQGGYQDEAQAFAMGELKQELPDAQYEDDQPAPYYGQPEDSVQPPPYQPGENELHTLFPPQPQAENAPAPQSFSQSFPQYPTDAAAPSAMSPRPPSGTTEASAPPPPPSDAVDTGVQAGGPGGYEAAYGSVDSGAQGNAAFMRAAPKEADLTAPEAAEAPPSAQVPQPAPGQGGLGDGSAEGSKHMEGMAPEGGAVEMPAQPFGAGQGGLEMSHQAWGVPQGAGMPRDMYMGQPGANQMMTPGMMPQMPQMPGASQMGQGYGMQYSSYGAPQFNAPMAAYTSNGSYAPAPYGGMPYNAGGFPPQYGFAGGYSAVPNAPYGSQNGSNYASKPEFSRSGSSGGGAPPNGSGRGRAGPSGRGHKTGAKGTRGTPAGGSTGGFGGAPNGGMDAHFAQAQPGMFSHPGYPQDWSMQPGGQQFAKDSKFPFAGAGGYGGYEAGGGYYGPPQGQQAPPQQGPPQYASFVGQQQGGWGDKSFSGKGGVPY